MRYNFTLALLAVLALTACAGQQQPQKECTEQQAVIDGVQRTIMILNGYAVWGGC